MAITKMKSVTIAGQVDEFDDIAQRYIAGRDIHLENAMAVLKNRGSLSAFEDSNEYEAVMKSAKDVLTLAGRNSYGNAEANESMTIDEMRAFISEANEAIAGEKKKHEELEEKIATNKKAAEQMELMLSVNTDIDKLRRLEFISCRFGHMPKTSFKMLLTYLNRLEAFFIKTSEDSTDVWGFYFTPLVKLRKTEEIFSSLYFETVDIPGELTGTPSEIKAKLITENENLEKKLAENAASAKESLSGLADKLCGIYNLAKKRGQLALIRRSAAHSDAFFYVVGWMSEKDAKQLEKEVAKSGDIVMFYSDDAENMKNVQPPTKLKNNIIFKPFEMFVKMYGLPSYNEIDPTPILAITYILFFGIMFGDVGQSAIFAILGFILYKVKKIDLAGIVGWVGLSGVVFGLVYGSFFGNEELIPELLGTSPLRPMEQAILMLGATIAMGVIIIIFGLLLHIINSIKEKNIGEAIFGHNGFAGLVFYVSVLFMAANMFLKWGMPNILFVILILVALFAMYMSEPLSNLVAGRKDWLPKDGMFFVENLFEMFEVVLSYFTNTISFLRIGAFAIVHVGMMMVVSILTPDGISAASILVMVIGNAVVMVLEGLIVGIQVLRLEYYEMFSRYFTGRGKEFVSLKDK